MLLDPTVLLREPLQILGVVAIIMLGKTLAAFVLVLAFRYPLNSALTVAASLAQIGEFSFILIGLGAQLGLFPQQGASLVLAGAFISIALNPLMFAAIDPLRRWALARSALARKLEARTDPLAELPQSVDQLHLSGQVVLVGYGTVGQRIAEAFDTAQVRYVVADDNREQVEALRARGVPAVCGDPADPMVLVQAHIARASILLVASPDCFEVRSMIETARSLNPGIEIMVHTLSDSAATALPKEAGIRIFIGEDELARAMATHALARAGGAH